MKMNAKPLSTAPPRVWSARAWFAYASKLPSHPAWLSLPAIPMNSPLLKTAVALTLLFCGLSAHAELRPFTADYSVRYQGIPATAQGSLTRSGENWTYLMTIGNLAASMNQATYFRERNGTYLPLGGSDRMEYLGQRRAIRTHYDWPNLLVRWSGDAKPSRVGPVPLRVGDLDALLLQLALVRDHEAGRSMQYRVTENARTRPATFRRAGIERFEVGGRKVDAVRYVQNGSRKTTTAWVAAGVPAPVQLSQQEDGRETVRLTMTGWR